MGENMKSIKILALGNSYSNDAFAWLHKIFESAGYDEVILGYIINGGCNINNHWSNIDDDPTNDFGIEIFATYNGRLERYPTGDGVSLRDAYVKMISMYEWDVVTVSHGPKHVEIRETYSHLSELIVFVKENLKNPNAKFLYHMIWKYNDNISGGSTMDVYDDILDITRNIVLKNADFVGVIPAATMRQNMMSSYLCDGDISRDYGHMGLGFGRYALGLLWYCCLVGGSPDDVSFIPSKSDVSSELLGKFPYDEVTEEKMMIAREAIKNAIASPYEITRSAYAIEKDVVMDDLDIDGHISRAGGEKVE